MTLYLKDPKDFRRKILRFDKHFQENSRQDTQSPYRAGGMAQVVELLPTKHKALSVNPNTAKINT
jgi:hypothetical protein